MKNTRRFALGLVTAISTVTIATLVATLELMFIFMKVVYVSLPLGVEPFSAVSLWLLKVMGVH